MSSCLSGWRSAVLASLVIVTLLFQTACGTLFYPERRGQDSGQIDPTVAILNGIGLLFFIVPGLVAFAVDFNTGAIYLPPDESNLAEKNVIRMDPDRITPETVSAVLSEHTGETVELTERDLKLLRMQEGDPAARVATLNAHME